MTAPRQRYTVEPYNLTWGQVAESVFQRSETWLRQNIKRFIARGFPAPDQRLDGLLFNRAAVEDWVNGPSGLSVTPADNIEAAMMEEAARGA